MNNDDIKAGDVITATVTHDINVLAPLTIPLAGKRVKLKASFLNPEDGLWGFMSLDPQPAIGPEDIGPHWLYLSQLFDVELFERVELFEKASKAFYPVMGAGSQAFFSTLLYQLVTGEGSPLRADTGYQLAVSFRYDAADDSMYVGGIEVTEDPDFNPSEADVNGINLTY